MVISTKKQIYMLVWFSVFLYNYVNPFFVFLYNFVNPFFFLYNYVNPFLCLLTYESEGP